VNAILHYLNSLPGCRAIKLHQDEYQANEPDIVGCLAGRFLALEEKREGERARPAQLATLCKWRDAGAVAGVVRSVEDVDKLLKGEQ